MLPWLLRRIGERSGPQSVPGGAAPNANEPTSESIFLEAAKSFLDVQVSTDDLLDSRNAGIFSVGSTVLPVTFGLLGLGQKAVPHWAIVSLALALGCYVFLLSSSWRASLIRGLEFRPHIPTLAENSEHYAGTSLQRWVALEYLASTEANKRVLGRKARWVGAANTLLYLEGFFLSLAALLSLL